MAISIKTPLSREVARTLKSGDSCLITGVIYTARDAAHKRLCELVAEGKELPLDVKDAVIYFVGPTPAKPGQAIGSAGPTTAYRMDAYSPTLLDLGQSIMIGKGARNQAVKEAVVRNGGVYLAALGGAGALMAESVKSLQIICWEDLGCEAVRKLEVENFPCTVINDCEGNDLYEQGRAQYAK